MPERDFFRVLESLLAAQAWSAAMPYFQVGARELRRRSDGLRLRQLLERVPEEVRRDTTWSEALLWTAFRANDRALVQEVVGRFPGAYPAFEAYLAARQAPWETVLTLSDRALAEPEAPGRGLAGRFRAVALAQLQRGDWNEAFREAAALPQSGRDRGLIYLEWAHQLSSAGQEAQARDAWARACALLAGDPWAVTQALSNLGITCLRLGDLTAAERALTRAVRAAQAPEAHSQLSIAWRGLGALYLWSGQYPRAEQAYRVAEEKADDVALTVTARRGLARVLRHRGRLDEALEVLRSALLHADVRDGEPHELFVDLAAVRVLLGDMEGARRTLARMRRNEVSDEWRAQIICAALARHAREADWAVHLQGLPPAHPLIREEARCFPEILEALGVHEPAPEWWIGVNLDGPVRVSTASGPVTLSRKAASLLALLAYHGGSVSVERALDALDLGGHEPRQRKRHLNSVVRSLKAALGWPGAVTHTRTLISLSEEPQWRLTLPEHPDRFDLLCEGLSDPWVTERRSELILRNFFV